MEKPDSKAAFCRAWPEYGYGDALAEHGGFDAWHDREFPHLLACSSSGKSYTSESTCKRYGEKHHCVWTEADKCVVGSAAAHDDEEEEEEAAWWDVTRWLW